MFTGLIKEIGTIKSICKTQEGIDIEVYSNELLKELNIDDSVSIDGVCQTVVSFDSNSFKVQSVKTTLDKTNFKYLSVGNKVNLELALTLSERLGGHLVQGHINGTGEIINLENKGANYIVSFYLPDSLIKYVVVEGSITLNGVSLTVCNLDKDSNIASVSVIPHTWNNTTFLYSKVKSLLNIEVDIIAKYVESFLFNVNKSNKYSEKKESKINEGWLKSQGFWD